MEFIIVNDKNEFWNGKQWTSEYPEAMIFESQTHAYNMAEKAWYHSSRPKRVDVIRDYGMNNQETVDTFK